jgi:hypothetical protein
MEFFLNTQHARNCFFLRREKNGHGTISWLHVFAAMHDSATMRPFHEIIDCNTYIHYTQAATRRLLIAAARVRAQVRSCGICGRQSGTGAGFLRLQRFSLPILIQPTAPHTSSSSIIRGWYNRPTYQVDSVSPHSKKIKKKHTIHCIHYIHYIHTLHYITLHYITLHTYIYVPRLTGADNPEPCLEKLVSPISKDKLRVKLLFKKEQLQNEDCVIRVWMRIWKLEMGFFVLFLICRNGIGASQRPHSCFYRQRSSKIHLQMYASFHKH